jgi:hypothetical protein
MPDDRSLPDRPPRRDELEAPYRHPFRVTGAATWRALPRVRLQAALAAVLIVGGGIGTAAVSPLLVLTVAVGVLVALLALMTWSLPTVSGGLALQRAWRQKSELRAVREARPHAGDSDPELVHDEFAVTAEDDGWLLTWRFRPLRVAEQAGDDEVEVPGRPRYAARAISEARFDAHDTAVAAEQLVAAQEDAAAREARAAAAAHDGITDATERAELAIEARTTAAALRRATGQGDRRR